MNYRHGRVALVLALASIVALAVFAQFRNEARLPQLEYSPGLAMHVHQAQPDTGRAIMAIHGGAWASGSPRDMDTVCAIFVQKGITCFAPAYPLRSSGHRWPYQITHLTQAIHFAYTYAKEQGRPITEMGIVGGSAGAHLAAWLAAVGLRTEAGTWRPAYVISLWGPWDLVALRRETPDDKVRQAIAALTNAPQDASPLPNVTRDLPRALLVHGQRDPMVPIALSEQACRVIQKTGARCTLLILKDSGHADLSDADTATLITRLQDFVQ